MSLVRGECTTALYNRLAREKVAKAEPRRRRRKEKEKKEEELRKNKQNLTQGVRKNTVLQYYRDGKHLGENHVIKNPILLKIPYVKNLAVEARVPVGFVVHTTTRPPHPSLAHEN